MYFITVLRTQFSDKKKFSKASSPHLVSRPERVFSRVIKTPSHNKNQILILTALMLIAFVLREARLDWFSFSGDEWYSYANAIDLGSGYYAILYFAELHLIYQLFGFSAMLFRNVAVLYGVLSVAAIYFLGKHIRNHEVGWMSALLLAISAYHIAESQDTRYYSQLGFYSILSALFFLRYVQARVEGSQYKRDLYFWILATVLNALTNIIALFLLAGQLLYLMAKIQNKRRGILLISIAGLMLVFAALGFREHIINTIQVLAERTASTSSGTRGYSLSVLLKLPFAIYNFVFGTNINPYWIWFVIPVTAIHTYLAWKGLVAERKRRRLSFWLLVAVLPLAFLYLVAQPLATPGFTSLMPKHAMFAFPFWVIIITVGIDHFARPALRMTSLLVLVLAYGYALYNYYEPSFSYYREKYVDFRRPGGLLQNTTFHHPLFVLDGRARKSFMLYNSQYVKAYQIVDPWAFDKLTDDDLVSFDAVILGMNNWKVYGPIHPSSTEPEGALYSRMCKRINRYFQMDDGFVQYPFYFYIFSKRNLENNASLPVQFYDLRYADLKLPQRVDGYNIFGSMSLPKGDSLFLELESSTRYDSMVVYFNLEDSRDTPKGTEVGTIEIARANGRIEITSLIQGQNIFDAFTRYYHGLLPDQKLIAMKWEKMPLVSGNFTYDGSFADFEAYIYRLPIGIIPTSSLRSLTIRKAHNEAVLRIWGIRFF